MIIKRVLLAVAQSQSLHVVHEAYLCKSCFRNRSLGFQKRFRLEDEEEDQEDQDDQGEE